MSLVTKLEELDKELTEKYEEYVDLHKELNNYRGKSLEDTEVFTSVNRILKDIQDKFAEIYPVYHFIAYRYQPSVNIVTDYNNFIDQIKKAGASAQEDTKH